MVDSSERPVLVIGSSGVDVIGRALGETQDGTSNPGIVRVSYGGVARNVAENLARLGMTVRLITAIGNDPSGQNLISETSGAGVDMKHTLVVEDGTTSSYLAYVDEKGNLRIGLDDMRIVEQLDVEYIQSRNQLFDEAQAVFVDANLPPETLSVVFSLAREAEVPIAADPTSVSLAPIFREYLDYLWVFTPNESEAEVLIPQAVPHADPSSAIDAARFLVSQGVEIAIITMAEFGLGYATASGSGHVPALRTVILDPTGAGDALSAAVIFALLNDVPIDEAVKLGLSAAALTLRTQGTVVPDLSLELLYDQL
jgi:pseudouridine kinase